VTAEDRNKEKSQREAALASAEKKEN